MKLHKFIIIFLVLLPACSWHRVAQDDYRHKAAVERKSIYPVDKLFIERWSPRAMSGEAISNDQLMTLFEAARWAPSSSNSQPWRFIYAHNKTQEWNKIFNCLVEFNQLWANRASALVLIISKNTSDDGKVWSTHSFDTGAAWMSLALQGSKMGLVVHGIGGFDSERARKELAIPDDYTIEAMCALGKPASKDVLPERIQKSEVPSQRKPLSEVVFKGVFGGK